VARIDEAARSALSRRPEAGRRAEALAVGHLEAKGFTIIARNWRRPEGELDVVARDGDLLVFVEVRSRTGEEHGHPLESMTPRKRARVVRAARLYLDHEGPGPVAGFRFDVVGVVFSGTGEALECLHVENAFEVGG
jgi:putative endonuclease